MRSGKSILLVIVISAMILSACGLVEQEAPKTYTVGVVNFVPVFEPLIEGFKTRMTELGYIEGENINYIYEQAAGLDAIEGLVASYIEQNVDIILSTSTPATQIVVRMTQETEIPVVFGAITDPVSAGIVASAQNPGANVTGVMIGTTNHSMRLDTLLKIMPDAKKLYAPLNIENDSVLVAAEVTRAYAQIVGVELVEPPIVTDEDALEAIESIPGDVDAFFVYPDTLLISHSDEMVEAAFAAGIPLIPQDPTLVENGALFSISNNWTQTGRDVAEKANQILQGTNPGAIPVDSDQLFLDINVISAEKLGITIPAEVLNQADSIIR